MRLRAPRGGRTRISTPVRPSSKHATNTARSSCRAARSDLPEQRVELSSQLGLLVHHVPGDGPQAHPQLEGRPAALLATQNAGAWQPRDPRADGSPGPETGPPEAVPYPSAGTTRRSYSIGVCLSGERYRTGGSHSSKRFPSGSYAQPKRPYDDASVRSSTRTPERRSWASSRSRSSTR